MIYFDTDHEAYQQRETIEKWGKIYLCQYSDEIYNDFLIGKMIWQDNELVLNPNWEQEEIARLKQAKYNEANNGAKEFLESGNALFEFATGKHIEATDGNIAKLTAYALAYVTGQLEPTETVVWNTKEDETVELTAEQIGFIVKGLGMVQASVWSVQFPQYLQAIENAETIEEVQAITIEYYSEIPTGSEETNEDVEI